MSRAVSAVDIWETMGRGVPVAGSQAPRNQLSKRICFVACFRVVGKKLRG